VGRGASDDGRNFWRKRRLCYSVVLNIDEKFTPVSQLKVYLPITENIEKNTTVQHQMAGCQRGLSLSKLATHGYNNVITTHINA